MDLTRVRALLKTGKVELDLSLPHALTEARKDGLTTSDLDAAVMMGEVVEDYGERVLLFYTLPDYRIPFHVVLEFFSGDDVTTVVTAYIPDREHWEPDWKTRRQTLRRRKK